MVINYLPQALDDLPGIWRYVYVYDKRKSVAIADRLIETIDETAAIYACQPELGITRADLDERLRCFVAGRYVVYYVRSTMKSK